MNKIKKESRLQKACRKLRYLVSDLSSAADDIEDTMNRLEKCLNELNNSELQDFTDVWSEEIEMNATGLLNIARYIEIQSDNLIYYLNNEYK